MQLQAQHSQDWWLDAENVRVWEFLSHTVQFMVTKYKKETHFNHLHFNLVTDSWQVLWLCFTILFSYAIHWVELFSIQKDDIQ